VDGVEMILKGTDDPRVKLVAEVLHPFFENNDWYWWHVSGEQVPTVEEIEAKLIGLLRVMETDVAQTIESGRIMLQREPVHGGDQFCVYLDVG